MIGERNGGAGPASTPHHTIPASTTTTAITTPPTDLPRVMVCFGAVKDELPTLQHGGSYRSGQPFSRSAAAVEWSASKEVVWEMGGEREDGQCN